MRQLDNAVIAEEMIRLAKSLQTVLFYLQEFCRVSLPTAEVEACSSCEILLPELRFQGCM